MVSNEYRGKSEQGNQQLRVLVFCKEGAALVFARALIQKCVPEKALLLFRASVCPRPLQYLQMTAQYRCFASPGIPFAAVRTRPLQHL